MAWAYLTIAESLSDIRQCSFSKLPILISMLRACCAFCSGILTARLQASQAAPKPCFRIGDFAGQFDAESGFVGDQFDDVEDLNFRPDLFEPKLGSAERHLQGRRQEVESHEGLLRDGRAAKDMNGASGPQGALERGAQKRDLAEVVSGAYEARRHLFVATDALPPSIGVGVVIDRLVVFSDAPHHVVEAQILEFVRLAKHQTGEQAGLSGAGDQNRDLVA